MGEECPSLWIMSPVTDAAAGLISMPNTFAPWRANNTAIALPFPQPGPIEPAPVTIAVFPVRSSTVLYLPTPISLMAVGGYHENSGRIESQSQCSTEERII
jgi:hypothetical protein